MGIGLGSLGRKISGLASGGVHLAKSAAHVASSALDGVEKGGYAAVQFSLKAEQMLSRQEQNFGAGMVDWGKSSLSTLNTIAHHPLLTAESIGSLAMNPLINPLAIPTDLLKGWVQGQSPRQVFQQGADQLVGLEKAVTSDYRNEYKKHGVAGVAGQITADVLFAVATGGESKAGEAVAEAGAKEAAEVASRQSAKGALKELAQRGLDKAKEVVLEAPMKVRETALAAPGELKDFARDLSRMGESAESRKVVQDAFLEGVKPGKPEMANNSEQAFTSTAAFRLPGSGWGIRQAQRALFG